jgi:hypothetical protein
MRPIIDLSRFYDVVGARPKVSKVLTNLNVPIATIIIECQCIGSYLLTIVGNSCCLDLFSSLLFSIRLVRLIFVSLIMVM